MTCPQSELGRFISLVWVLPRRQNHAAPSGIWVVGTANTGVHVLTGGRQRGRYWNGLINARTLQRQSKGFAFSRQTIRRNGGIDDNLCGH